MSSKRALISLVAPSGSGKSTVAQMIEARAATYGLQCAVVKLAAPLYELQTQIYRLARVPISKGAQNHSILENCADQLRALNPNCIVTDFLERVENSTAQVIVNDDLRDPVTDWPRLREVGFKAIRIVAARQTRAVRMRARNDLLTLVDSKLDGPLATIQVDEELVNDGADLDELRARVDDLADRLLRRTGSTC
jgi:cytidylate kinase